MSCFFVWVVCFVAPVSVRAAYVLPYPSFMPGNKIYRITRIIDTLRGYWSYGNIAQVKYHLSLSDKYLVEAKTLFEYQQYLLAVDALDRSAREFSLIGPKLNAASREGKDVTQLRTTVREAAVVHRNVITKLTETLPSEFNWTPEKTSSTKLDIAGSLEKSLLGLGQN